MVVIQGVTSLHHREQEALKNIKRASRMDNLTR